MGTVKNLVIEQGATSRTALVYNHAIKLVCPVLVNSTVLKCSSTTIEIPDAKVLKFKLSACETLEVTTNGVTPIGSESVNIQAYTGLKAIPTGSTAKIAPVDLTGEIWRGFCRRKYADLLPAFSWTFTITPLAGLVVATVSDEISTALVIPDKEKVIFSDIPSDVQLERNFPAGVWSKAWFYDWEREFANGEVERVRQGRLWLVAEVTR